MPHSAGITFVAEGSVTSDACRPTRITSTIFGASSVSRGTRLTQEVSIYSVAAISHTVSTAPLSSIRGQRNA